MVELLIAVGQLVAEILAWGSYGKSSEQAEDAEE